MRFKLWHLPVAYAAIAVMTFGHSAATRLPVEQAKQRACEQLLVKTGKGYCFDDSEEMAAVSGFLSATLWPLYWSWEAWS